MIKIFGHKAPDTDTVCSALAYAWFKNKTGTEAEGYRLGDLNKETKYVLNHFDIESPQLLTSLNKGDQVIIVDTNNVDELPENINDAEILEIVDHQKRTGSLSTYKPIPVIIKPIASTATIIWKHIKHSGVEIEKSIAGLLLAGIVSDTLKLTSPTTTEKDRSAIEELLNITGENLETLADEMFAAKGDLTGMSARDVLLVDSKIFEMGSNKVRVSVLESTKPENALSMKEDLLKDMAELKAEEGLNYLFFFAIDILNSEATLLTETDIEKELASKAFDNTFKEDLMTLPGVVSRKKQIIPSLQPVVESEG